MINSYRYQVSLQQADFTRCIAVNSFVSSVLATAGDDAGRWGVGIDKINTLNATWVLSRLCVEIYRRPAVGEEYVISTWIADFGRLLSTRNFEITTPAAEVIGAATSQWCIIDMDSRRPLPLSCLGDRGDVLEERASLLSPPSRVVNIEPTTQREHRVVYSDIDFNGHVNTIRYIELMLNAVPLDMLKAEEPLRLEVQFLSETLLGDTLTLKCEERAGEYLFELIKSDTVTSVRGVLKGL